MNNVLINLDENMLQNRKGFSLMLFKTYLLTYDFNHRANPILIIIYLPNYNFISREEILLPF